MKKDFIFNPSYKKHKVPLGALSINESTTLTILVNKDIKLYEFSLVIYNDLGQVKKEYMNYLFDEDQYKVFNVTFSLNKPYIYWYYFEFNDCYGKHYLGSSSSLDCILYEHDVIGFQINVYEKNETKLSWFKGKVMYQIMVDRFCKGGKNPVKNGAIIHNNWDEIPLYKPVDGKILNNDFFRGDFQGIIKKIPYLKNLNVSVLYLNPIFLSPSNHKYNTSDYMQIDPMFGTLKDFEKMIKTLKENDINVILDGVFNHTGDDSIYFNRYNNFNSLGACQSKDSPYYNWYKFIKYPNEYESWWGIKTLPSVNQNSGFVDFITSNDGVINKWINFGIKGFRLDVVDEISDDFLRKITKAIKKTDAENIVIGEVWEDASNKIAYSKRREYFNGHELDSAMNYMVREGIIDYLRNGNIYHLVHKLRQMINNFPKTTIDSMMNILSTHDTSRALTEFSPVNYYTLSIDERANFKLSQSEYYVSRSKLKMASIILYTIPGVPCLYYGDEAGLDGHKDPFCRKTMPWDHIDEDILSWYQNLGRIRKEEVFVDGDYDELIIDDQVFAYTRTKYNDHGEILVQIVTIINNGNHEYIYNFTHGYDMINQIDIFNYAIIYPQTGMIIKLIIK